jgi:iron(III) transport system substrate-binding protein
MGEEKGIQYFKDLVQITNLSTRTGNSVLAELVAAGEVPYALTVYSYKTRQLKADGAPLEWYAIEPAFARSTAVAVAKHAPHPYSAVLFFDYLLSEGQQILADMHYDPANRDYELQDKLNIEFMDDEAINRERDKWFTLFEDIIIKKIR